MTSAIFQLDTIATLPLWAQALIASRMARRATLWLAVEMAETDRAHLLAGCDALDRCARVGERGAGELAAIERAKAVAPVAGAEAATRAVYFAADAAHAAQDSLDFSAAETACVNSSQKAIDCAANSPGMTPLQARIYAAADLDQLRFACREAGVGRYDALGDAVMLRLCPVYPPDPGQVVRAAPPAEGGDGRR